ncbi:MAG: alcohol dehydrogenase catalytic domain-containing protein [Acidimicrobiia bacterium]|nr:alcohol dehydrogenase catalytic domain-containing protein [Acidimicrobiia bacterium]MYC85889.1 alcohol dehydrogenase catalytic domain-containing protein [Acidimicrobiia bacterium]
MTPGLAGYHPAGHPALESVGAVPPSNSERDAVKAAVVTGPGQVEFCTEPYPTPGPDQVLVELAACGVCTFERRLFAGHKRWYPVSPGHEISGFVVEAGSGVDGLEGSPQVGEAVTVDLLTRCMTCGPCRRGRTALCLYRQGRSLSNGTFSFGGLVETIAVDAKATYPVGNAPMLHAAMGEPIACTVHSLRRAGFGAGDRVAIIGGGFMGRLHMSLVRIEGASAVGVVDISHERRWEAEKAGADWVARPEAARQVGGLQDVVFVTAMGGLDLAVEMVAPGGSVVLYSAFDPEAMVGVAADRAHRDEVSIVGVYSQEPEDWERAVAVIRSGVMADDLDNLVTARFPLSRVHEALTLVTSEPTYRVFVENEPG